MARRAEEDFEFGKDCFGLDQSQLRLYTAIARHTVLVMAALAICAVTAALLRRRTGTAAPAPAPPDQTPPPPGSAAHWLDWRRHHQARSRWYHQRTRLAAIPQLSLSASEWLLPYQEQDDLHEAGPKI